MDDRATPCNVTSATEETSLWSTGRCRPKSRPRQTSRRSVGATAAAGRWNRTPSDAPRIRVGEGALGTPPRVGVRKPGPQRLVGSRVGPRPPQWGREGGRRRSPSWAAPKRRSSVRADDAVGRAAVKVRGRFRRLRARGRARGPRRPRRRHTGDGPEVGAGATPLRNGAEPPRAQRAQEHALVRHAGPHHASVVLRHDGRGSARPRKLGPRTPTATRRTAPERGTDLAGHQPCRPRRAQRPRRASALAPRLDPMDTRTKATHRGSDNTSPRGTRQRPCRREASQTQGGRTGPETPAARGRQRPGRSARRPTQRRERDATRPASHTHRVVCVVHRAAFRHGV